LVIDVLLKVRVFDYTLSKSVHITIRITEDGNHEIIENSQQSSKKTSFLEQLNKKSCRR